MVEAFLRYYVLHLPHHQWQSLFEEVPDLKDWKLIQGWKFNYEQSYGYEPGTNIHEVAYAKRKCDAVIEHHQPQQVSGSSQIWTGELRLPTTFLDDILVLLSIACSRHVHALSREYFHASGGSIRTYPSSPETDSQPVIPDNQLSRFLVEALKRLHTKGWDRTTGFLPAIHWYYQAHITVGSGPSILELAMYWITLEVLARARGFQGHKKAMVSKMLAVQHFAGGDWVFLSKALSDWYKARNTAFHEGEQPSWTTGQLAGRLKQVREFTSLVLADLLVPQSAAWKGKVASRIQGYYSPTTV